MSLNSYFRIRVCAVLGAVGGMLSAFAGVTKVVSMDDWTDGRYTLFGGEVYTVSASKTLSANFQGESPLNVSATADNPAVIYIPSGVTLTLNGATGSGRVGGAPGLAVSTGKGVIVCGGGSLVAVGGCPGNGSDGEAGENGYMSDNDWGRGGAGGVGGAGGGGGGAAIGGAGGVGAASKAFGHTYGTEKTDTDGSSFATNGYAGETGNTGGNGEGMGDVYVFGSMTVVASLYPANYLAGGEAGTHGESKYNRKLTGNNYWAGGGGGGGGGASGAPAVNAIGGGGAGGGSGGTGGGGYLQCHKIGGGYCWAYATGGKGGYAPAGGVRGTDGAIGDASSDHKVTDGERIGTSCWGDNSYYCGAPGASGAAGSNGANGSFFASSLSTVLGRGMATTETATAHASITYALNLDPDTGSTTISALDVVLSMPYPTATVPTAPTGYTFTGWYTGHNGTGTQVYAADGTCLLDYYTTIGDTTLYACWTLDETAAQKEFVVNTADDPTDWSYADDVVSLREAFEYAKTSTNRYDAAGLRRITFDESLRGAEIVLTKPLQTTDSTFKEDPLTIEGLGGETSGIRLNGNGSSKVIEMDGFGNSITFKNLDFRNFFAEDNAGDAIFDNCLRYGFWTFVNCRFEGNKGNILYLCPHAGAKLLHCSLVANDLHDTNRASNEPQEAILYAGGALSSLEVFGCTFADNLGSVLNGNVNVWSSVVSSVAVQDSTFVGNQSDGGTSFTSWAGCVNEASNAWTVVDAAIEAPVIKIVDGVPQTGYPLPRTSKYLGQGVQMSFNGVRVATDIFAEPVGENFISAGSLCSNLEPVSVTVTTLDDIVDDQDGLTSLREAVAVFAIDASRTNSLGERAVQFASSLPVVDDEIVLSVTNGALAVSCPTNSPLVLRGPTTGAGLVLDGAKASGLLSVGAGMGLVLENLTLQHGRDESETAASVLWSAADSLVAVSNCCFRENVYEGRGLVTANGAAHFVQCTFAGDPGVPLALSGSAPQLVLESTFLPGPETEPPRIAGANCWAVASTLGAGVEAVDADYCLGCVTGASTAAQVVGSAVTNRVGTVDQVGWQPLQPGPFAGRGVFLWHDAAWQNVATSVLRDGTEKTALWGDAAAAALCFDQDVWGRTIAANRNSIGSVAAPKETATCVVDTFDESDVYPNEADGLITLRDAIHYATNDDCTVTFTVPEGTTATNRLAGPITLQDTRFATAENMLTIQGPTNATVVLAAETAALEVTNVSAYVALRNLSLDGCRARAVQWSASGLVGRLALTSCSFFGSASDASSTLFDLGADRLDVAFDHCSFVEHNGPVMWLADSSVGDPAYATFRYCTVAGNTAASDEWTIYARNLIVENSTFTGNAGVWVGSTLADGYTGKGAAFVGERMKNIPETNWTFTNAFATATSAANGYEERIVDGVLQRGYPIRKWGPLDGRGEVLENVTTDILGNTIPTGKGFAPSAGSWCQDWELASTTVTTPEDVLDSHDGLTSLREACLVLASDGSRTNALGVRAVTIADDLWPTNGVGLTLSVSQGAIAVGCPTNAPLTIDGGAAPVGLIIAAVQQPFFDVPEGMGLDLRSLSFDNAVDYAVRSEGFLLASNCVFRTVTAANESAAIEVAAGSSRMLNCTFDHISGRPFHLAGEGVNVMAESTVVPGEATESSILEGNSFAVACTVPSGIETSGAGQAVGCMTEPWTAAMGDTNVVWTLVGTVLEGAYRPHQPGPLAGQGVFLWHDDDWLNLATSKRHDGTDKTVLLGSAGAATACYDTDATGWTIDVNHNSTGSYACRRESDSLVVSFADDELADDQNEADGLHSLRCALRHAETNTTLAVKGAYTVSFTNTLFRDSTHTLSLKATLDPAAINAFAATPLVIAGPSDGRTVVLDGQGQYQIVDQAFDGVTYKNLSFTRGVAKKGGAILAPALAASSCSFLNNAAEDGGAVHLTGSDASKLDACLFTGNSASGEGGGAVVSTGKSLGLTNCVFTGNIALNATTNPVYGGAVKSKATLTAANCRFEANTVGGEKQKGYGGAVYASGAARVERCTFTGNTATQDGGGAYFTNGGSNAVTVVNASVLDNTAGWGGGLYFRDVGTFGLYHTTLRGNAAKQFAGGIYIAGSTGVLGNSIVSGNTAGLTDATHQKVNDVHVESKSLTIVSSLIAYGPTNHVAGTYNALTGGVHTAWNNAYAYISGARKDDRVTVDDVDQNYERPGAETWGTAVALRHTPDWSTVQYQCGSAWSNLVGSASSGFVTLTTDVTGRDLAGETPSMGSYWMVKDKPTLVVDTLKDAKDEYDGQHSLHEILYNIMDATSPWATNLVKNGRFDITFKAGLKGVLKIGIDPVTIEGLSNCLFTVIGPTNETLVLDGQGKWRAFSVGSGNQLQVANLTFSNCVGRVYGSYTSNGGGILNKGTLSLTNCAFYACSITNLTGDGGAVYTAAGARTLVADATFAANRAAHGGALGVADGGALTVLHSTFADNAAQGGGSVTDVDGGALFVKGAKADALVANCTFTGNTVVKGSSKTPGNAIAVQGAGSSAPTLSVVNSILVGNGTNDLAASSGSSVRLAYTQYGARAGATNVWADAMIASNVTPVKVFAHVDADGLAKGTVVAPAGAIHRVYPLLAAETFDAAYVRGNANWTKASYSATGSSGWKLLRGSSALASGCTILAKDQLGTAYETPILGAVAEVAEREADEPADPEEAACPGAIDIPAFSALVEAIQSVASFNPAVTYATNTAVNGTIAFSEALTFSGSKTLEIHGPMTFDAQKTCRFFTVPAGFTLKLYDITFTNGVASGEDEAGAGGAILVQDGGTLYASNCTFTVCTATYGGAVAQLGETSSATFIDCRFDANEAEDGASIYHEGTAELVLDGTTIDYADIVDYPVVVATPSIASIDVSARAASQQVEVWPAETQPNVYYGLAWTENLANGFSKASIQKWVKSDGHGTLAEPLTAPATGTQCFYRIFVQSEKP